jgi:hypothetical protein
LFSCDLISPALKTLASIFASSDENGIVIADSCQFKPNQLLCAGGAADFASDDGSSRMLHQAQSMEEIFPTYNLYGQGITPVNTHHRMLSCSTTFTGPDCNGSCSCSDKTDLAKCKARYSAIESYAGVFTLFVLD